MKQINVNKTVSEILSTEDVQFKKLNENKETGEVILATPVNDGFQRAIIIISPLSIGVGVQGPDEQGKLVVTFQPVSNEILHNVRYVGDETQGFGEGENIPDEIPKKPSKKGTV